MRRLTSLIGSAAALALGFGFSSLAHAQSCAPGDWFCDPASEPAPPPAPTPPEPERAERDRDEPLPPPRFRERHLELDQPDFRPHPRRRHRFPRWGVSVHVFGALLGDDSTISRDASMGGLGIGIRRFFVPEFAFEANGEFGFGTDYNGYDRQESALLLHGVGVLNPRSVVRAYIFGGLGFSTARVHVTPTSVTPGTSTYDDRYNYVGLDLGGGVEIRVTRHAAIHADILGFVRDRTDDNGRSRAEFIDPKTGRTTNASGGALLRVGTQFYW
ncbi:MAG: hypothetical protein ACOY0T_02445 [Myxococcota bacterium]